MKVWIYKGEILPYKSAAEDKIRKEAAMAVGETVGPGPDSAGSSAPVVAVAVRPARRRRSTATATTS